MKRKSNRTPSGGPWKNRVTSQQAQCIGGSLTGGVSDKILRLIWTSKLPLKLKFFLWQITQQATDRSGAEKKKVERKCQVQYLQCTKNY